MCGSCAEQGFANAAVTSFAFDADDGSGNEGSDQEDTEAEVEHSGAKAGPHDKAAASSGTSSGGKESSSLTAEVAVEAHSVAGSASNKLLAPVGGSAVDGSQAAQQHVEQLESKEGAVVARAGQGTAGSQRDNPRLVHALLEVRYSISIIACDRHLQQRMVWATVCRCMLVRCSA